MTASMLGVYEDKRRKKLVLKGLYDEMKDIDIWEFPHSRKKSSYKTDIRDTRDMKMTRINR